MADESAISLVFPKEHQISTDVYVFADGDDNTLINHLKFDGDDGDIPSFLKTVLTPTPKITALSFSAIRESCGSSSVIQRTTDGRASFISCDKNEKGELQIKATRPFRTVVRQSPDEISYLGDTVEVEISDSGQSFVLTGLKQRVVRFVGHTKLKGSSNVVTVYLKDDGIITYLRQKSLVKEYIKDLTVLSRPPARESKERVTPTGLSEKAGE